jgi:FkbM family methyltransferase
MSTLFRSLAHNRLLSGLRTFVRSLPGGAGLFRFIARSMNKDYEERFHHALLGAVKHGDVVWDIGANVGFYTDKFLDLVGDNGHVVAIEPTPASAEKCRAFAAKGNGRLSVMQVALGKSSGTVRFSVSSDDPTSVTNAVSDTGGVEVEMLTADALLERIPERSPDLLKLDVEGFETDVLEGMTQRVLKSEKLRALFIEVHTTLLEKRGITRGGQQIEQLLRDRGFRTDWVTSRTSSRRERKRCRVQLVAPIAERLQRVALNG